MNLKVGYKRGLSIKEKLMSILEENQTFSSRLLSLSLSFSLCFSLCFSWLLSVCFSLSLSLFFFSEWSLCSLENTQVTVQVQEVGRAQTQKHVTTAATSRNKNGRQESCPAANLPHPSSVSEG